MPHYDDANKQKMIYKGQDNQYHMNESEDDYFLFHKDEQKYENLFARQQEGGLQADQNEFGLKEKNFQQEMLEKYLHSDQKKDAEKVEKYHALSENKTEADKMAKAHTYRGTHKRKRAFDYASDVLQESNEMKEEEVDGNDAVALLKHDLKILERRKKSMRWAAEAKAFDKTDEEFRKASIEVKLQGAMLARIDNALSQVNLDLTEKDRRNLLKLRSTHLKEYNKYKTKHDELMPWFEGQKDFAQGKYDTVMEVFQDPEYKLDEQDRLSSLQTGGMDALNKLPIMQPVPIDKKEKGTVFAGFKKEEQDALFDFFNKPIDENEVENYKKLAEQSYKIASNKQKKLGAFPDGKVNALHLTSVAGGFQRLFSQLFSPSLTDENHLIAEDQLMNAILSQDAETLQVFMTQVRDKCLQLPSSLDAILALPQEKQLEIMRVGHMCGELLNTHNLRIPIDEKDKALWDIASSKILFAQTIFTRKAILSTRAMGFDMENSFARDPKFKNKKKQQRAMEMAYTLQEVRQEQETLIEQLKKDGKWSADYEKYFDDKKYVDEMKCQPKVDLYLDKLENVKGEASADEIKKRLKEEKEQEKEAIKICLSRINEGIESHQVSAYFRDLKLDTEAFLHFDSEEYQPIAVMNGLIGKITDMQKYAKANHLSDHDKVLLSELQVALVRYARENELQPECLCNKELILQKKADLSMRATNLSDRDNESLEIYALDYKYHMLTADTVLSRSMTKLYVLQNTEAVGPLKDMIPRFVCLSQLDTDDAYVEYMHYQTKHSALLYDQKFLYLVREAKLKDRRALLADAKKIAAESQNQDTKRIAGEFATALEAFIVKEENRRKKIDINGKNNLDKLLEKGKDATEKSAPGQLIKMEEASKKDTLNAFSEKEQQIMFDYMNADLDVDAFETYIQADIQYKTSVEKKIKLVEGNKSTKAEKLGLYKGMNEYFNRLYRFFVSSSMDENTLKAETQFLNAIEKNDPDTMKRFILQIREKCLNLPTSVADILALPDEQKIELQDVGLMCSMLMQRKYIAFEIDDPALWDIAYEKMAFASSLITNRMTMLRRMNGLNPTTNELEIDGKMNPNIVQSHAADTNMYRQHLNDLEAKYKEDPNYQKYFKQQDIHDYKGFKLEPLQDIDADTTQIKKFANAKEEEWQYVGLNDCVENIMKEPTYSNYLKYLAGNVHMILHDDQLMQVASKKDFIKAINGCLSEISEIKDQPLRYDLKEKDVFALTEMHLSLVQYAYDKQLLPEKLYSNALLNYDDAGGKNLKLDRFSARDEDTYDALKQIVEYSKYTDVAQLGLAATKILCLQHTDIGIDWNLLTAKFFSLQLNPKDSDYADYMHYEVQDKDRLYRDLKFKEEKKKYQERERNEMYQDALKMADRTQDPDAKRILNEFASSLKVFIDAQKATNAEKK